MYVSTAKVLRRFAQKVAATAIKDPATMTPEERINFNSAMSGGKLPGPDISDRVDMVTRPARTAISDGVTSGVNSAVAAGKTVGDAAKVDWQQNVNPLTLGLGGAGGAALLYAIAKMRQSEEDRKKGRQPILAPLMGAAGGAALAPLLAGLATRMGTSYRGGPLSGDIATMDATMPGGAAVDAPTNSALNRAPIA